MTKLLDQALGAVRALSAEEQDKIASMMLAMTGSDSPETIDPAHLTSVLEGLEQVKRGELASAEEVAAAFRRFGG